MLQNLIHNWEERLSQRDRNRRSLPFEWGWEFLETPSPNGHPPVEMMRRFNANAVADGEIFFRQSEVAFKIEGDFVRFPSSIQSPYPENNVAVCRYFPAAKRSDAAVVVLPQWN